MQRYNIVKMIGNVSDWLSYADGALIKVADSAGSTVEHILVKIYSIHVIPPSSSGRLQEISRKIGKNPFQIYHFLAKIQNLPEMNQDFSDDGWSSFRGTLY